MVGPEVPDSLARPGAEDCRILKQGVVVRVQYISGLYHELGGALDLHPRPDLVVCFNAGVWGYSSWGESLRFATEVLGAPAVVTAYSREESEDDRCTLEEQGVDGYTWEPQQNPFASLRKRTCGGLPGDRENAWWYCLKPGSKSSHAAPNTDHASLMGPRTAT
mmetsp:Transcript_19697/g.62650  ORF Transcript_19697/g.62650 Transcript_19697/m.62650 type:complete len:163 (-) Transcript_19697:34-522(-)